MSTKGGGSAPAAPDFTGAANAMAQYDWYAQQYAMGANRPNIVTPTGSMTWTGPGYTPPPFSFAPPTGGILGGTGVPRGPTPNRPVPASSPLPNNPYRPVPGGATVPAGTSPTPSNFIPVSRPQIRPPSGGAPAPVPIGSSFDPNGVIAGQIAAAGGSVETATAPPRQNTQWDIPNGPYVATMNGQNGVWAPGYGFFSPKIPDWLFWGQDGVLHNKNATDPTKPWNPPAAWRGEQGTTYTPRSTSIPPTGIPGSPGNPSPTGPRSQPGSIAGPQGNPGGWTMNVNLSPAQQALLEQQQNLQYGRGAVGTNLLSTVGGTLNQPITGGGTGQDARDAIYAQAASRLDPMWNQKQAALETQLRNQGFVPGSEGWTNALGDFNRARTDAYQTAINQSIMGGTQQQQQQLQMELAQRAQALNELNSILSGQQVASPTFPAFAQGQAPQAPNLLGAQSQQYQAALNSYAQQQAGLQNMMGGFASLAPLLFTFAG